MRVTSRRSFAASLGLAVAVGIVGAPLSRASAQLPTPGPNQSNVELMTLEASNGPAPGSIDPKVDEGKPAQPADNLPSHKLKTPPLSAYNTYKFKDRQTPLLTKGAAQHVKLPNGRMVEVVLKDVTTDNKGVKRSTVVASISQPSANGGVTYMKLIEFTASPHQSVFVGGITGNLVVAFTVDP
jgi:hypothetical protein